MQFIFLLAKRPEVQLYQQLFNLKNSSMKKTKSFAFVLVLFTIMLVGTNAFTQSYDVAFNKTEVYRTAVAFDTDTVEGTTVTASKVFKVARPYNYTYMYQMSGDSVLADSTAYFILAGSLDGLTYYNLDTATWYLSTPDTTVIFNSGSTKIGWQYLKGTLQGNDSTKAALGKQHLQVLQ